MWPTGGFKKVNKFTAIPKDAPMSASYTSSLGPTTASPSSTAITLATKQVI